jgi:hypothetical protein
METERGKLEYSLPPDSSHLIKERPSISPFPFRLVNHVKKVPNNQGIS